MLTEEVVISKERHDAVWREINRARHLYDTFFKYPSKSAWECQKAIEDYQAARKETESLGLNV